MNTTVMSNRCHNTDNVLYFSREQHTSFLNATFTRHAKPPSQMLSKWRMNKVTLNLLVLVSFFIGNLHLTHTLKGTPTKECAYKFHPQACMVVQQIFIPIKIKCNSTFLFHNILYSAGHRHSASLFTTILVKNKKGWLTT